MDPLAARRALAALRMTFGASWLMPKVGARLFGLDPDDHHGIVLLTRLFAIRDVALGAALLRADEAEGDRQVDLGIMVDTADLIALVAAAIRKDIGVRTLLLGGLGASGAIALGLMGRRPDA